MLVILLISLLTASIVLADEIQNIYNFQLLNKVIEGNKQLLIDELNIMSKESALDDVNDAATNSKYIAAYTSEDKYDKAITEEVKPLEAEAAMELAIRTKDENLKSLQLTVYKTVMDALLLDQQLEIEKMKLIQLEEKYELNRVKYKSGTIDELTLLQFEFDLSNKKNDIQTIENKLIIVDLELKKILEQPFDGEEIHLQEELMLEDESVLSIEQVLINVFNNNRDIYAKNQDLLAKKLTFEIAERYLIAGDYTYDKALLNYQTALIELEDLKKDSEINIRNKSNELLIQRDKVELADISLQLADKKLKESEFKYKNGGINKEVFLNEQEKYLNSLYQYYVAIKDYNVKKAEFENL